MADNAPLTYAGTTFQSKRVKDLGGGLFCEAVTLIDPATGAAYAANAVTISSLPALPAGSATIGYALNLVTSTGTWTLTPSTAAYSTGMSLGGVQTFTVPANGKIKNGRFALSSGSYTGAIDLLLFSSAPGSYVDNAAVTLSVADQAKLLGVLHFNDAVSLGGNATLIQTINQSFAYNFGGTTIWVLPIIRGAATFAASSSVTLNLTVEQ